MSHNGLQVLVLGELTLIADGRPFEIPGSRKTRALLGYLLLQQRSVTREHLCELLWPHPDNPRAALRWSLTKLRPALMEMTHHLVTDRNSVQITGFDDRVDLCRVDRLLKSPLDKIPTPDLLAAAGLFHGELLEGLEIPDCHRFNEWLIARSEAARRSRRRILETLTARFSDQPEEALVHARTRVSLDPLDEAAHIDVVRLLSALGRVDEAHRQVDRCREILEMELGISPGSLLSEALHDKKKSRAGDPIKVAPVVQVQPTRAADSGLFGRADECVQLETFLSSEHPSRILLFEGEPGIGKSRLLAEMKRRAEVRQTLVLIGRSWEVEVIRPLGAWIDLLSGLPLDLVPAELRADLGPIMPSLGEPRIHSGEWEPLVAAVKSLLQSFLESGRDPVLVFDDLHWIDHASAELLNVLCRGQDGPPFKLAGACRPGEFADNDAARSLVRGWNRAGHLERIPLKPLPDRDAAALARAFSDTADVETLVASCGGNPLYLIESVREGPNKEAGLVSSLIADRLAVLDEPTVAIARWAAVMSRSFPAARMADLASQSLPDFLARVETLERHGILRPHGDEWDFAHDLLRRATLADLSGPRRKLMHRRVAHTMAAEPDPDGALAGEVAFHAGRGGEPELAARAAVTSGDRGLSLAAFEDAWLIADRGLAEVPGIPTPTSLELHVELLRVQVLARRGRQQGDRIIEELLQLAQGAKTSGLHAVERTARWLLSVVTEEAGDFDSARKHSLDAEKASRTADPQTRLRALANTARCLVQLEREPLRAGELLGEAQDFSETLGTPVLDIPWGLGLLRAMEGRSEEARAAFEQGAAMAHTEKNHWARFECLSRLSMLDLQAGDLAGIEGRDPLLREVAGQLGEGSEHALAGVLLALARKQGGSPESNLDQALDDLRAADSKGLLAYALNEAGRLELADGQAAAAARCADEAAKAADEVGRHHQLDRAMLLRGRAALLEGDQEATESCLHWLDTRLEILSPEMAIHEDLVRLREDITKQKERPE